MTNKQFVKSIYPDAQAFSRITHNGTVDWAVYSNHRVISKFVYELTPKIAWKNGADKISKDMLEKLES